MDDLFCCESCASTAVRLPRDLHELSEVLCAGCGSLIETLGELRARAERLGPVGRLKYPEAAYQPLSRL
jgi:hypothetical protein